MPSLPDSGLSIRELDVLFDQSPTAMVFGDRELRARRTNAAFRRLVGLPDEAIIGRRPSEEFGVDTALIERTLAEQVIDRGIPVIDVHLERTLADQRRVLSWSACRVTDNGQVLGALGFFTDITDRVQAVMALRQANARLQQANARLDLLERAGSQIGTTLDVRRTAGELAALAVPELADRIVIDRRPPWWRPGGQGRLRTGMAGHRGHEPVCASTDQPRPHQSAARRGPAPIAVIPMRCHGPQDAKPTAQNH